MNIVNNIKREFRTANSLNKIIYINVFIFLILNIFSVFFGLFMINIYDVKEELMLPSDINKLISKPWSLVTYMFVHDNFIHLLFNMIWLHFGGKLFLQFLNQKQLITTINYSFRKNIKHKAEIEFGYGNSFKIFNKILYSKRLWKIDTQKQFQDI